MRASLSFAFTFVFSFLVLKYHHQLTIKSYKFIYLVEKVVTNVNAESWLNRDRMKSFTADI
jgi:hypothetical protein